MEENLTENGCYPEDTNKEIGFHFTVYFVVSN
jgi:hypothetical protein